MIEKFQRNYRLEVEGGDGEIYVFRYPLTLQFSIQRAALASANTANLRLYNLSQDTRKAIYKDYYDNVVNSFRSVKLMAGYDDTLSTVIDGNINEAKSYREEGSVDFITEIDCYDWSFAMVNCTSDFVLGPPTYALPLDRNTVIDMLIKDLVSKTNVTKGMRSDFNSLDVMAPYSRPYYAGGRNTWDLLKTETNDHCFIDSGVLHCLFDDDYFEGDLQVIDSSTGLLSTPKKSKNILKIDILFEPAIRIGQVIQLISESESLYNDIYKVIGIQHTGVISGAVSGKCKTSLSLNAGEFKLNKVTGSMEHTPVALGGTV